MQDCDTSKADHKADLYYLQVLGPLFNTYPGGVYDLQDDECFAILVDLFQDGAAAAKRDDYDKILTVAGIDEVSDLESMYANRNLGSSRLLLGYLKKGNEAKIKQYSARISKSMLKFLCKYTETNEHTGFHKFQPC